MNIIQSVFSVSYLYKTELQMEEAFSKLQLPIHNFVKSITGIEVLLVLVTLLKEGQRHEGSIKNKTTFPLSNHTPT